MKNLLLISSSGVHGYGYLDHPEPEIRRFLGEKAHVKFIPYALADQNAYTQKVAERLGRMGYEVTALSDASDLKNGDALFAGGGNTWRLLKALYDRNLIEPIRDAVNDGFRYIGSSAGTNITAPTIMTTNDMPIVEVPSMNALALVPFQINPHYLDPEPSSTHMGETREERILQFLEENSRPVVGLREGSMLRVEGSVTTLLGSRPARIFRRGLPPLEAAPGTTLDALLETSPAESR